MTHDPESAALYRTAATTPATAKRMPPTLTARLAAAPVPVGLGAFVLLEAEAEATAADSVVWTALELPDCEAVGLTAAAVVVAKTLAFMLRVDLVRHGHSFICV